MTEAATTERPATAIAEYSPTAAALADLRARYQNVVWDVTTTKGDKEARAARRELVTLRTTLEAKRKELKAPALERTRLIDAEAKSIEAQIRALEEDLGAELFVRSTKGVTLTEAGEALLAEVPNLLSLAERAKERALKASHGESGQLDIGIFGSGVLDVIPRILARFHAARPEVKIVLHNLTKTEQIAALRERRISVGFNRLIPPEDDLKVETVLREAMMVALPEKHPLAKRAELTIPELSEQPLILYPRLPIAGLAQMVMQAFVRETMADLAYAPVPPPPPALSV